MTSRSQANDAQDASVSHGETDERYVSHNHQVARELAAAGVPVFPANPELNPKKLPDLHPHKSPIMVRSWPKEATTNQEIIDNWWRKAPDALVAMPTKQLGLIIIDADRHPGKPDGFAAFEALLAENGGLPEGTVLVDTQSHGRHYIFKQPKGLVLGNSSGGLPPEVDTRGASGDGGYVIAPGTIWIAPDGESRQWKETEGSQKFIDAYAKQSIPVVPDWIIKIIKGLKQTNKDGGNPRFDQKTASEHRQSHDRSWFSDGSNQQSFTDDVALVTKALAYLDAGDRHRWMTYGAALYDRFGEAGRPIWDDWSKTCPDKYDPVDQDRAWRSFGRGYSGQRVTIGSIIYDAKKSGFKIGADHSQKGSFRRNQSDSGFDRKSNSKTGHDTHETRSTNDSSHESYVDHRPIIQISGGGISDEADQAEQALLESGIQIFQRGGELVFPYEQEVVSFRGSITYIIVLERFSEPRLIDALCRSAIFKRGDKTINPPAYLAKTILARKGEWNFPSISGVSSTPIIRPDGSLVCKIGYDPQTRLYIDALPTMPIMPDKPTRDDALVALRLLKDLIAEFPFIDPASHSAGLSAIISAVVRSLLQNVPMHITTAPSPGSGKSFLIDLAAQIATGEKAPVSGYAKSVDENEKRIDGALLDGQPIFSFDNVNGELSGDKLCQAIECPRIDVRRLGSSDKFKIENRMTIYATGNNIIPTGDMTRRTILISLDAGLERPETRQFKTCPDQIVRENRGVYVAACLTIVRTYILAGKPNCLPRLASFGDWSDFVRSALVWLGCADPVETLKILQDDDPEHQLRTTIFHGIHEAFGSRAVTVKQMISTAYETLSRSSEDDFWSLSEKEEPCHPELHDGLMEVAGRNGTIVPDILGKWLRSNKGRIAGGLRLNNISTSGTAKWTVSVVG
jgi:putative DNA primase/helicase